MLGSWRYPAIAKQKKLTNWKDPRFCSLVFFLNFRIADKLELQREILFFRPMQVYAWNSNVWKSRMSWFHAGNCN